MAMNEIVGHDEPAFVISVAARLVGVRTQTLRYYESLGLVEPYRTKGNQRVYSRRDVERVRRIRNLMDDLGVNLAGVEVLMRMLQRLEDAESRIKLLEEENEELKSLVATSSRRSQRR